MGEQQTRMSLTKRYEGELPFDIDTVAECALEHLVQRFLCDAGIKHAFSGDCPLSASEIVSAEISITDAVDAWAKTLVEIIEDMDLIRYATDRSAMADVCRVVIYVFEVLSEVNGDVEGSEAGISETLHYTNHNAFVDSKGNGFIENRICSGYVAENTDWLVDSKEEIEGMVEKVASSLFQRILPEQNDSTPRMVRLVLENLGREWQRLTGLDGKEWFVDDGILVLTYLSAVTAAPTRASEAELVRLMEVFRAGIADSRQLL